MFNEKSIVVRVWINNVNEGLYTKDEVPNLSNLREIVLSVLGSGV